MKLNINIDTQISGSEIAQEVFTKLDEAHQTLWRQVIQLQESGVREALIALGWTPPGQTPAAPVQEPVACKTLCEQCVKRGYDFCANVVKATPIPAPAASVQDDMPKIGCVNHDCDQCKAAAQPAPVQEPSGWVNHANIASAVAERERGGSGDTHTWSESKTAYHTVPFYTTPPAAPAQVAAVKTLEHLGYTYHGAELWKPPIGKPAPVQESFDTHSLPGKSLDTHSRTPAAQRQWVSLTDEEIFETHKQVDSMQYLTFGKAIEAKLRELNGLYRQHVTDGSPCWCEPETSYTDPETGASVIVHREPQ